MAIRIGDKPLKARYKGSQRVKKVMNGTKLVWEDWSPLERTIQIGGTSTSGWNQITSFQLNRNDTFDMALTINWSAAHTNNCATIKVDGNIVAMSTWGGSVSFVEIRTFIKASSTVTVELYSNVNRTVTGNIALRAVRRDPQWVMPLASGYSFAQSIWSSLGSWIAPRNMTIRVDSSWTWNSASSTGNRMMRVAKNGTSVMQTADEAVSISTSPITVAKGDVITIDALAETGTSSYRQITSGIVSVINTDSTREELQSKTYLPFSPNKTSVIPAGFSVAVLGTAPSGASGLATFNAAGRLRVSSPEPNKYNLKDGFAASFWIQTTDTAGYQTIIHLANETGGLESEAWVSIYNDTTGRIYFGWKNNNSILIDRHLTGYKLNDGLYHHVAVRVAKDPVNPTLAVTEAWIDGIALGTIGYSGQAATVNTNVPAFIGGGRGANELRATLSRVSLWDPYDFDVTTATRIKTSSV